MTQANEPDAWNETFLVSIQKKGGTAVDFRALLTTYDMTGGDKDISTMANAKGGRIKKMEIQTDYEVTLEGYATQVGNDEGFFDLLFPGTADSSQPLSYSADHDRSQFLLSIAHTTSTTASSAVAVSVAGDRTLRDTFKNGHFTSVNQTFTDGICKFTLKFKAGPFDKSATSNVTFESSDGSSTFVIPAITYT